MPAGHSCCIVGCTSSSHNWKGEKRNNGLSFYRIPKVKTSQGSQAEEMTVMRRRAWIAAIRRPSITVENSSDGMRVCSRHFHSGIPAYEMMAAHPDWAPSLHLGHTEVKETDTSRHERRRNRENKQGLELHAHQSEDTDEITACGGEGSVSDCGVVQGGSDMVNNMVNQSSRDTQTDISGADMDGMQTEINRLLEENRNLKEKLADKGMHASAFEGNKEKVKYYTGLASFITLTVLLNYLLPYLPRGNRRVLSPFQMLIVCFMRLRLNSYNSQYLCGNCKCDVHTIVTTGVLARQGKFANKHAPTVCRGFWHQCCGDHRLF